MEMWRKIQEATIKHPKWGPSLSPSLLFTSFQWWQTFRRKNLYPISPLPLLGFPFLQLAKCFVLCYMLFQSRKMHGKV